MDLKDYIKTPEGIEMVNTQARFCLNGSVWSAWKGNIVQSRIKQLSDEELKGVHDVDGTMHRVWMERRQQIEGRFMRKMAEYDERRATLRKERSAIRAAIKEDRELGISPSPDDQEQLKRIDLRQARLGDLKEQQALELALVREQNPTADPEDMKEADIITDEDEVRPACSECGKEVPAGKNPKRWLNAHMMGAHNNRWEKQRKEA